MTLTDTQELLEQVKACTTAEAVSDIIAEYGEDCTAEEAAVIFRQRHANSTELLCANPATHFGCCSCGTQFTV